MLCIIIVCIIIIYNIHTCMTLYNKITVCVCIIIMKLLVSKLQAADFVNYCLCTLLELLFSNSTPTILYCLSWFKIHKFLLMSLLQYNITIIITSRMLRIVGRAE